MLGSLDDPSQKTQSLKCFSYPRHPKSSKYLVRRCGRNPSKPNLRKCLGVQTPTHQIFGCLGIDTIPLSQYLNHLKGKSPFYPRLTAFLPGSVQFLGYFEVTSRSRVSMKIRLIFAKFVVCPKSLATCSSSREFKWFPGWRWFTPSKGHFTIPKKSQRIARILKLSVDGKETTPFSKWLLTHPLCIHPNTFQVCWQNCCLLRNLFRIFLWLQKKKHRLVSVSFNFQPKHGIYFLPVFFTPLHQQVWAFGSNRSMELGGLTEPRSVRNGVTCHGKIPGLIKYHLF